LIAVDQAHARGDAREMRRAIERALPRAEDLPHINAVISLSLGESVDRSGLPPISVAFARELEGRAAAESPGVGRIVGREYDFLGERTEIEDWTIAQFLNVLRLRRSTPTKRAAVIGTMRDDGIYALEWIAHYQTLGFDTLVIYSNDNADSSEQLLRRLDEHGEIIFIESLTSGRVRPEVKAFEHAFHFVEDVRACEWALFVDSDEFLVLAPRFCGEIGNAIDELNERSDPAKPSAVLYHWLWFNSGMVFERKPGLLTERFCYATPNWLTKPLVRLRDLLSMRLQHVPELFPGASIVDSRYRAIDSAKVWKPGRPDYSSGRINHYWTKSFQEFSLKKARGDALPLEDDEYRRSFSLFFEWNAPETLKTYYPPDGRFLAKVKARCEALRALEGVHEAEMQVERRFSALLDRYKSEGGLERIYRALRDTTASGGTPTS
jgi:hypothetical protein